MKITQLTIVTADRGEGKTNYGVAYVKNMLRGDLSCHSVAVVSGFESQLHQAWEMMLQDSVFADKALGYQLTTPYGQDISFYNARALERTRGRSFDFVWFDEVEPSVAEKLFPSVEKKLVTYTPSEAVKGLKAFIKGFY